MSTPPSRWIDARISDALAGAFAKIDGYQRDGYCTEEDVYVALMHGWDEAVAEGWREWLAEGDS